MADEEDMDSIINEFSMVCRGCLNSSRELKNMFDCQLDEDFYRITDLKVNRSDQLSQLICTECEEFIKSCRSFKKQCRQSNYLLNIVLKKQTNESNDTTFEAKKAENTLTYTVKEDTLSIKITAPNIDESISYSCPQNCPEKFKKKSDLILHMKRHHNTEFEIDIKFYCTEPNCHYNLDSNSGKYFTGRKYLNQHINKVHKNKTTCQTCSVNFPNNEYEKHLKFCNILHICQECNKEYKTKDRLLVHMMRKHPNIHKQYKVERKAEKRKSLPEERVKNDRENFCDSPKRTFATQTLMDCHIKNDVALPPWQKTDETKKDEISTQTAFDELFSMKSQTSDEFNLYTESVSDIQTQTVPLEFGLSRSNKETITSETQSPDLSIKETQTCFCLYDTYKPTDIVNSFCMTSTQTQTLDFDADLLSFSSAETQTCFEEIDKTF